MKKFTLFLSAGLWLGLASGLHAQTTAFTYQGKLDRGGTAAIGTYDLQFSLYNVASGGAALAGPFSATVIVTDGLFAVPLDFGAAALTGQNLWLQIAARTNGAGSYTNLSPRVPLRSAPYSVRSLSAGTASNLAGLLPSAQLSGAYSSALTFNNPANSFAGNGAGLTSLNASSLASGAVPDARLSGNIPRLNADQTFTGNLTIANPATLSFGASIRQMLNLWGANYGLGVQGNTLYCRSDRNFAWYKAGTHAGGELDAGGGTVEMALNNGKLGIGTASPSRKLEVTGSGDVEIGLTSTDDDGRPWTIQSSGYHGGSSLDGTFQIIDRTPGAEVARLIIYPNGNVSIPATTTVKVLTVTGGADVAEPFQMSGKDIPKGAVVVIDEDHPGQLRMSDRAYDPRVAGIVSGANGIKPGIQLSQEGVLEGGQDVALSGRVYALADATDAPIKPGDLLTTSDVPGHCMKASDRDQAQGAVLGKAMTGLKEGRGQILVLVTLQ